MKDKMMSNLQIFWRFSWRSVFVALGYLTGLILAGMIGVMLGETLSTDADSTSSFAKLFVASLLLGVFSWTLRLTPCSFAGTTLHSLGKPDPV
jgi:hypothetical protein